MGLQVNRLLQFERNEKMFVKNTMLKVLGIIQVYTCELGNLIIKFILTMHAISMIVSGFYLNS